MRSFIAMLLGVGIMLVPPLSVVGLFTWTRRLRKLGAPRFAVWVAFALVTVAGLVISAGYIGAAVVATHASHGERVDPSEKARALAEGISEVMNCGAFGLILAFVAAAWIGFWGWRRRP